MSEYIAQDAEQPSGAEVKQRYLFTQCLEAVRCLEEGVLTNVRDGDVGVIMAVGFPAFTGGPFTYIDNYGVDRFVQDASALEAKYGERFAPPRAAEDDGQRGQELLLARNWTWQIRSSFERILRGFLVRLGVIFGYYSYLYH